MQSRRLVIILGDQLRIDSPLLKNFDRQHDVVWMAEVSHEATKVWSHKARIVMFLSAMRHFRERLKQQHFNVHYVELDDPDNSGNFAAELTKAVKKFQPHTLAVLEPGEWSVREELINTAKKLALALHIEHDDYFLSSVDDFANYANKHKKIVMEYFYREMRVRYGILVNDNKPEKNQWNFDKENRQPLKKSIIDEIPQPKLFVCDSITKTVIQLVEKKFSQHPGQLKTFSWPITEKQAKDALDDFISQRLKNFGTFQDAMWSKQPWLFHSRLSAALNLHLISPLNVIHAVQEAYYNKHISIANAEGFIRQILGWREYIRGIYWRFMPDYYSMNALNAEHALPAFYWTAETDMQCLRETLSQTLEFGYAHHIQRLMVSGLFALLYGVKPYLVHEWYLAIYVDAVEWVELPNTLGMSQFADGGRMASKPYCASGKYLQRMSNYCQSCRYNPAAKTGSDACPFTTLYWDFLLRNKKLLVTNQRMLMQLKNLDRLTKVDMVAIQQQANNLREKFS